MTNYGNINKAGNSKIVWTGAFTVAVNAAVAFGILPEALGPATIEVVNVVAGALITYFRIFKTVK